MENACLLVVALALDAMIGEPRWVWARVPHPAIIMGKLVGWLDTRWNHGSARRAKGIAALTVLVLAAFAVAQLIALLPAGPVIETIVAAVLLAHRSLCDHVGNVANSLRISLSDAKRSVGLIVSRDTAQMNETEISRAAIESAAENFSDGVIAPAFWFLILGLPGILIYKITNTADSMIGYRTSRHEEFGWASARFDDLLNWVPARLTAALIATAHWRPDAWAIARRDAPLHKSPNAGWPEAAVAAVLGVALAGPRRYGGQMRDFPLVNPQGRRTLSAADIDATVSGLWRAWFMTITIVLLLAVA